MKIPSLKKNIIIAIIMFSVLLIIFGWLGWQNNFLALEASKNSTKNISLSSKSFNYNDLQNLPKSQNEKIEEQVPEIKETNLDNPNPKDQKTLYPQITKLAEIEEIKEPPKYRSKPKSNYNVQTIKKKPHLLKPKNKRKIMQKKMFYQNQKIIDLKEQILLLENEKNATKEIDNQFSDKKNKPQLESQIQGMNIYNVYLGKTSDKDMALEWLRKNFSNQHYQINFSYGLYNSQISQSTVFFDSRIKEPPPKNLLLVYFDGGIRDKTHNCYSLEALKSLGNGAQNMYILWQDENPFNDKNFIQNNFCTDLIYEKGYFLGGPSYLSVKYITLKNINTNEIIATFPVKCQIEVPCSLDGLDLELKFPFYNYKIEGLLSNTHIKSLRKIDVCSKHTGQTKTLYYKV